MKKDKDFKTLLKDEKFVDKLQERLYSKKRLLEKGSPFSELLQSMVNGMLAGEMSDFMDEQNASGKANKLNGHTKKSVISEYGNLEIKTPRDRNGEFQPELIEKRQRELSSGLDAQIIALYAQGNSIEDVRRLLMQIYGVSIASGKISQITDKVLPQIQDWRERQLEAFYPIVYLDAIHFKVREDGKYTNNAFYTVYSIDWEGNRDLLGLYIKAGGEGANQWAMVLEDLKQRGVKDVLVMCTDNLTGFSEVIQDIYPQTVVQKCIVHQVRNSLRYVDSADYKSVVKSLRSIYTSTSEEKAKTALAALEVKWASKYPHIIKQWTDNWQELMAFLDFPSGMRKMIYTTNPVEALHRIVRKLIKSKAAWVSQTAVIKQIYLSLMHNEKSWKRKARGWKEIQRDIAKLYPERIPDRK